MCRLSVVVFVCFSLTDLSVYGRIIPRSSNVIFPGSEQINIENISPSTERTTRQVNRRPVSQQFGNVQPSSNTNSESIFEEIDFNNNQPSSGINEPPNQSIQGTNACVMSCKEKTTQQYSPVCGTDSQTYQNQQNLNCVANCGIRTEFNYIGRCLKAVIF